MLNQSVTDKAVCGGTQDSCGWMEHPLWLRHLAPQIPETAATPAQVAAYEADWFLAHSCRETDQEASASGTRQPKEIRQIMNESLQDAFVLEWEKDTVTVTGGERGILYGTYELLQDLVTGQTIPQGVQSPACSLRMLDCWDNMDGSIERGYAGRSIWFEENSFCYDSARVRQLGRFLSSAGINMLCLNNVNVHAPAQQLIGSMLQQTAVFADLIRPFGVRLMICIDFSMPLQEGLPTADPADTRVREWWKETARKVWRAIPDCAGFLVKADSEHRPGPNTYGRTHAEGANMLAEAAAPYGGYLVWRAFVYNCMQDWRDTGTDRPCAAYEIYHPLDGLFLENVILQVKYGPFDFQVREPLSPLLVGMRRTHLAMELQLAQEYTGQQIDLYAMPPMWKELADELSGCDGMNRCGIRSMAAVSNLGRDDNWTGHPMAALNLYAFGRYAWNPDIDPKILTERWIRLSYDLSASDRRTLTEALMDSRMIYEKYTAPLGLCWMVRPNTHYGPDPYGYEFQAWGTYNRADRNKVGIDRTAGGTGYLKQYPSQMSAVYENPDTCPEGLLLFFHRLPYDWRMRDGRTLIQRIYDDHFEGYEAVLRMEEKLSAIALPEPDRSEMLLRMQKQKENAKEWCDMINTFFCRLSGIKDMHGRKIYAVDDTPGRTGNP